MQRNYPYHPQQMQHMQQQQQLQQRQLQQQQNQWYPQQPTGGPGQGYLQMPNIQQQELQQMNRQISIEDAIRIGREQVPGQVVKAELERKGGRLIYEVDVVTNQGVKYEVKIDAN